MTLPAALDEMVDGRGRVRPHWRDLLGTYGGMGAAGLADRTRRLDRAFEEEGVTSLLPGRRPRAWRCDPVPLPLPAAEFAALEAGLAQRARLLERVLGDIYGAQGLLAAGVLPPALVFANPGFLRPCRDPSRAGSHLDFYAADLIRGPDGGWRVLADRTASPAGLGYARENRRQLARVMPEAFAGFQIRQHQPFFDIWQDSLLRLAPPADRPAGIALLTQGIGGPHWFEHVVLARALSCALVEGDDLTIRDGAVFLKTLRGLRPIDVLLRRVDGRLVDSLELEAAGSLGVPGLLDAGRHGRVRITNAPGTGAVEAPALAAWLPALCLRLLGETLMLPSVPTMWLGERRARTLVQADPARWLIRPATDGRAPATALGSAGPDASAALLAEIDTRPWAYAATAALSPSVAPSVGPDGLVPRPVVLRLFLAFDGTAWRAFEGGLARVIEPDEGLAGALPFGGLSKDVWVLGEHGERLIGPPLAAVPPLPIRRTPGDLPSRVADDFFWFGRYVERLEGAARLIRAALHRLDRGALLLPRELAELQVLADCLADCDVIPEEAARVSPSTGPLAEALLASVGEGGEVAMQLARLARFIETVRDRLTGEMYAGFSQALRQARRDAGRATAIDALIHAMTTIVRMAAEIAGVAAETMVRGGGWLFLELGRRIERSRIITAEIARAMALPGARIEAGLRLSLELRDCAITYHARYHTVLQPAPVLDLVLADRGNPRGLAFQLAAIGVLLDEMGGPSEAAALLRDAEALVDRVARADDQAGEAALLPDALAAIRDGVGALSDRIARRYFALLPTAQTVGARVDSGALHGAA